MKSKNLGATTQHLSLAVMMEVAASTATATMMMRTTLEGVMMVMLDGVVGLEGVVMLEGVVVRCHPFSLLGRQISPMPHRIKIMVHSPHNDKRKAVDELDLLQSTHRICNSPHRIGEGCHRHRYRNNLFILPFGYQVRMDYRCVSV